ncbi:aldo/keto reductase [Listeria monocytogenes]|uniref:aldo/keto reductase n=1 Tax=Listeria monocytogenes TaxID=1639 RepID=UPI000875980B|nr:aldo/keto reductase [Listeria monocytogenes]EAD3142355.1 aldo/keto reductase [Listeria monocytogenes]EAD5302737.1 aldo/keto reductase [Listeria monocytogenes]EAE5842863.1 aldo/keto reductase [Listeria monocytogenes]EAV9918705.1 aldo/keto reductase [Listeria monocytogenes]EIF2121825.1 aldo/keto reductase [Listeria monocytogenes]
MDKRQLGKTGLVTSELGFGCMGLNYHRGPAKNRNEMIEVVRAAMDSGITMFDTAEVYGPYTNEELVGEALSGKRNHVQIATKGGFKIDGLNNEVDSRPESLKAAVEGSLKRLKTDYIDLYYIHRIDPSIPIEEVAGTIKQLKQEGKILHWGLSEASAKTIRRAHKIEPLATVESEYSIWWREAEQEIFPVLEELGIGLVAYSPLGRGYLSGKLDINTNFTENDNRGGLPRFQKEAMKANQVLLDFMKEIAYEQNVTTAQLAIAWILDQKPWIVPIPGTTRQSRIKENIASTKIHFDDAARQKIATALSQIEIVGDRYSAAENKRIGK